MQHIYSFCAPNRSMRVVNEKLKLLDMPLIYSKVNGVHTWKYTCQLMSGSKIPGQMEDLIQALVAIFGKD